MRYLVTIAGQWSVVSVCVCVRACER